MHVELTWHQVIHEYMFQWIDHLQVCKSAIFKITHKSFELVLQSLKKA